MKLLLSLISVCCIAWYGSCQLVINEYSCSNVSTIPDAFSDYEDWVELYNAGPTAVDLTGYFLSDKSTNLDKWEIPAGSIPPNGYQLIICSGRNAVAGNQLHPDFRLTQTNNEWIILSNPNLNVVDSIQISRRTKANHSIGRATDGASDWKLFTTPTPNAANTGAVAFYTSKPIFSVQPGFYTAAQTVSITCPDPGTTIRYTVDGSQPTSASTLYAGPVTISETQVLRAVAFGSNEPSFTTSGTYFINVSHTVPVLSIAGQEVATLLNGNAGIEPTGFFEMYESDQSFVDRGEGNFNKHGNDSWAYDQRGFDFIMRDQFGYNDAVNHAIFPEKDRTEFQRLIIKAAASDNYPFENGATHIRDAFVHTLSQKADLKLDERTWKPCVVYLNGEYWGVYEIREKVDDSDFTDYYYQQDKFNLQYLKTWGATWEEYGAPNANPAWNDLVNYVATNNMATAANFNYVDSLLNWESMVDYFVLNSYIVSKDWLNWNTGWWRGMSPTGDKKKWRYTLWDMDACFGHYTNFTDIPDESPNADPCNVENLPNPGNQGHTTIMQKLIDENPTVKQYYITRYVDLVNTYFSCDYMNFLLDSMLTQIQPEMQQHITRWGGSMGEWQTNVQALKNFIDARCAALTQGMIDCYALDGPYEFVVHVSPANSGTVRVNSTWAPTYPWQTNYFGGIETKLLAQANTGFAFSHWEYVNGPLVQAVNKDTNAVFLTANDSITAIFIPSSVVPTPVGTTGIQVPTAFSPNLDGKNDFLTLIIGPDVKQFTFTLFDRWGNRIVETGESTFAWDGTWNNKPVNIGVYAYQLEIFYLNGQQELKSGNITLTR